jgi:tetratricopeptide (TPR) repeat protein
VVHDDASARAAEAAAGLRERARTALARAELASAAELLERATRLFDHDDPRRTRLLPELGQALLDIGETQRGLALLEEAAARAEQLGDPCTHGHARLSLLWAERFAAQPAGWARATGDAVEALVSEFERADDDCGVARAWTMLASLLALQGRTVEAGVLAARARDLARREGDARTEIEALRVMADALVWGPTPADEAARTLEQTIADGVPLALEIALRGRLAALRAGMGDAAAATANLEAADRLASEAGLSATPCRYWRGITELWLGDSAAAEQSLGAARAAVSDMTRIAWATLPALHGEALSRLGRYEEAASCAAASRDAAAEHDLQAQLLWRTVEARALARRGDHEQATALARSALALAQGSDTITLLADAELALTEVRLCAADADESAEAAARAAAHFGAKGMTPWEAKARRLLHELTAEPLPQGA